MACYQLDAIYVYIATDFRLTKFRREFEFISITLVSSILVRLTKEMIVGLLQESFIIEVSDLSGYGLLGIFCFVFSTGLHDPIFLRLSLTSPSV